MIKNIYQLICLAAMGYFPFTGFSQNVGIGTASPSPTLQVEEPNTGNWLRLSITSGTGLAFFAPSSYPTIDINTEYGSAYDRIETGFAGFFQHLLTKGVLSYFSSAVSDNAGTAVSTPTKVIFQLTNDGTVDIGGSNADSKFTIPHNSTIIHAHLRLKANDKDYVRTELENVTSIWYWQIAGFTPAASASSDLLNTYHHTVIDIMRLKDDGTIGIGATYTPVGYQVSIKGAFAQS